MTAKRILSLCAFALLLLASCGPNVVAQPQATIAPLTLPATWTPSPGPTAVPTFTEFPTYTPVPAFTPLAPPTNDSLKALGERFQDSLFSPDGRWVAYRDPEKLRVVNEDIPRTWTLPCALFKDCTTVYPVRWSRNGRILYFAPAPTVSGAPNGISLVTALGMIDILTGKWDIVLPDSQQHYDFTFSPEEDYLAYTQSSGMDVEKPTVILGLLKTKNNKVQDELKVKEAYGGNIVWSPFKPRLVFVVQTPKKGSSVVYYDMETSTLKYVLTDEQSDIILSAWNDSDNLVVLEEKDWIMFSRSYWLLNPFSGEMSPAYITPTPKATATPGN